MNVQEKSVSTITTALNRLETIVADSNDLVTNIRDTFSFVVNEKNSPTESTASPPIDGSPLGIQLTNYVERLETNLREIRSIIQASDL